MFLGFFYLNGVPLKYRLLKNTLPVVCLHHESFHNDIIINLVSKHEVDERHHGMGQRVNAVY